ncbi:MAG: TatD family hydrolase [Eubacteriaceae bacterium]|jgi:TatD DNase family protein
MLTDTHAHLDDEKLNENIDEVMERARQRGMGFILNPGCDYKTSAAAVALSQQYPEVYAGVGFHPMDADKYEGEDSREQIRKWAALPKTLAIGEIGLDYHYPDNPDKATQKKVFEDQLDLAGELMLPVIIHDREAHKDSMDLIREYLNREASGVFHAYSGSVEMAREILDLGMYISIGGPLTFKNARKTPDVIAYAPLDRIMLETDSPYMAPEPVRGTVNEPSNTWYIAQKMADIKQIPLEQLLQATAENAERLFRVSFVS